MFYNCVIYNLSLYKPIALSKIVIVRTFVEGLKFKLALSVDWEAILKAQFVKTTDKLKLKQKLLLLEPPSLKKQEYETPPYSCKTAINDR